MNAIDNVLSQKNMSRTRGSFWVMFLEIAAANTSLYENAHVRTDNCLQINVGKSGVFFETIVNNSNAWVDICVQHKMASESEALFDALLAHREAVETSYAGQLSWERKKGHKRCKICTDIIPFGLNAQDNWKMISIGLVERMVRFHRAFRLYI